jgi:hypothetical protein
MVAAGMTPAQVITAATKNAAEFLKMPDTGTLEVGKNADFIVLDASKISQVVLRGARQAGRESDHACSPLSGAPAARCKLFFSADPCDEISPSCYFALRYRTSILAPVGSGLTLVSLSSSPDRSIPLRKSVPSLFGRSAASNS